MRPRHQPATAVNPAACFVLIVLLYGVSALIAMAQATSSTSVPIVSDFRGLGSPKLERRANADIIKVQSPDPQISADAWRDLCSLPKWFEDRLLNVLLSYHNDADSDQFDVRILSQCGVNSIAELIEAGYSPDEIERGKAAEAMANMPLALYHASPNPASVLQKLARDPNPEIRADAFVALSHVAPIQAAPFALKALYAQYPEMREAANVALSASWFTRPGQKTAGLDVLRMITDRLRDSGYRDRTLAAALSLFALSAPVNGRNISTTELLEIKKELDQTTSALSQTASHFPKETLWKVDIAELRGVSDTIAATVRGRQWYAVQKFVADHAIYAYVFAGIVALQIVWLSLLWLSPLWLLRINRYLRRIDVPLPPPFQGAKIPLRALTLVNLYQYPPRVIDAYLSRSIGAVRANLALTPTFRQHDNYIPLPVAVENEVFGDIRQAKSRMRIQSRFCFLIYGDSGTGKTSLACELARRAMSNDSEYRFARHLMIPCIVASELKDLAGPNPFRDAIRGSVQALLDDNNLFDDELFAEMLRTQRILVIADHFSELSDESRHLMNPADPSFPANALIVTSRRNEQLGSIPRVSIVPQLLNWTRLSSFMETYLQRRNKKQLFTDQEYFDGCSRLSGLIKGRSVTVLLAKLYADLMIKQKEINDREDPPKSVPALMSRYLREVYGENALTLSREQVERCCEALGWASLTERFQPGDLSKEQAAVSVKGLADGMPEGAVLQALEDELQIIQTVGFGRDYIRFSLDPFAEFFAARFALAGLIKGTIDQDWFTNSMSRISERGEGRNFRETFLDFCDTSEADGGYAYSVLETLRRCVDPPSRLDSSEATLT